MLNLNNYYIKMLLIGTTSLLTVQVTHAEQLKNPEGDIALNVKDSDTTEVIFKNQPVNEANIKLEEMYIQLP